MQSFSPSLVHNEQTSVQNDPQPAYGDVLRASCRPQYAAALRLYSILDAGFDKFRASRLRDCRQNAWFARHIDSGEVRVASTACSLRWCPVCSNLRRNYMTHEIGEWIGTADHPKLVTLTLKHSNAPLEHQIKHLYLSFRELRRRKDFKASITGGIWFFQIKRSSKDGLWHPHIHALVTGLYLPRRRLSHMWCEVTHGSIVSEIRAIHDPQKVANDVARYATSPGDLTHLAPDDAIEMFEALHGRRICGKWGTAKGVSLRPKLQGEKGKWEPLGSWSVVFGQLPTDPNAKAILHAWKTNSVLPEGINCNDIESAINRMIDGIDTDYNFESVYDHM